MAATWPNIVATLFGGYVDSRQCAWYPLIMSRGPKPRQLEWSHPLVVPDLGPCRVPNFAPNDKGYVTRRVAGRNVLMHRAEYELAVGPIPAGYEIDHLCRNRACCEPSHLEAVTPAVNARRALAVRRGGEHLCGRGLHDMRDPEVFYLSPQGKKRCRPCHKERSASYRATKNARRRARRRPRKAAATNCMECGALLQQPAGGGRSRMYCSQRCRQSRYRKRKG